MAEQSWINRACDLEDFADFLAKQGSLADAQAQLDKAQALVAANSAPGAMDHLKASLGTIPAESWAQVAEMAARVRASRKLAANNPKSIWARRGGDKMPAEIMADELLEFWPDPIERRGCGGGSTITTPENLSEFERRLARGETQKAAAQAVFEGLESAEHKADRLIKYWRKQRR